MTGGPRAPPVHTPPPRAQQPRDTARSATVGPRQQQGRAQAGLRAAETMPAAPRGLRIRDLLPSS